MLLCDNDTYYTGYTNDVARRYEAHINGTGRCKYTRSFKPIQIAQQWDLGKDKRFAMKVEKFIKQLSRKTKEDIIQHPEKLMALLITKEKSEEQA